MFEDTHEIIQNGGDVFILTINKRGSGEQAGVTSQQ
jgi:hypothetical protein